MSHKENAHHIWPIWALRVKIPPWKAQLLQAMLLPSLSPVTLWPWKLWPALHLTGRRHSCLVINVMAHNYCKKTISWGWKSLWWPLLLVSVSLVKGCNSQEAWAKFNTMLLQQTEGDCIKEWFWPLVCNQNVIKVLLKWPTALHNNCWRPGKGPSFVCSDGKAQQ